MAEPLIRNSGTADLVNGSAQIRLVLASQSPRRIDLLRGLGLQFEVIPSHMDETMELGDPAGLVRRLAREKAQEIVKRLEQSDANGATGRTIVLGADTIVVLEDDVLGKPATRDDVVPMLRRLSGRMHEVYTGVALIKLPSKEVHIEHQVSRVHFRQLDEAEMAAYSRIDEPMDKAGSYALQGVAACFVARVDGCYTNVIGLPIPLTVSMLRHAGLSILDMPHV